MVLAAKVQDSAEIDLVLKAWFRESPFYFREIRDVIAQQPILYNIILIDTKPCLFLWSVNGCTGLNDGVEECSQHGFRYV